MYTVKSPAILKPLAKDLVWKMPAGKQHVYFTFDDGPTPGVTDVTLDLLRAKGARATFFCLGKNVVQHPDLFQRILSEGHAVGNHSYDHPDGWNTEQFFYPVSYPHPDDADDLTPLVPVCHPRSKQYTTKTKYTHISATKFY